MKQHNVFMNWVVFKTE